MYKLYISQTLIFFMLCATANEIGNKYINYHKEIITCDPWAGGGFGLYTYVESNNGIYSYSIDRHKQPKLPDGFYNTKTEKEFFPLKVFENRYNLTGDGNIYLENNGKILTIPREISKETSNIVLLEAEKKELILPIDKICKLDEVQDFFPNVSSKMFFSESYNVVIDDNANKVTIKTNCKKEVTINLKDLTIEKIIPYDPNNICDNLYNPCWTKFELLKNHLRCYVRKTREIFGFEK